MWWCNQERFKIVPECSGKKQRDEINSLSHRLQRVDYCKAIMKNKMAMLMRLNIASMLIVTMMKLTSQY